MKSKIEKLPSFAQVESGTDFELIHNNREKINEIIDHLNSQDQEEYERGFSDGMAEEERDNIKFEKWNENERKKREILIRDTLNNGFELHYTKDTPEDTEHIKAHKEYLATSKQDTQEEWEKEFKEIAERYYEDGSWVDIDSLVDFIKQLLEEKETKAFNEGVKEMEDSEQIQADWDIEELGNIVDKIVKKLSKLTTK